MSSGIGTGFFDVFVVVWHAANKVKPEFERNIKVLSTYKASVKDMNHRQTSVIRIGYMLCVTEILCELVCVELIS